MADSEHTPALPENRTALEALIEAAIARLDDIDPEPDLEPDAEAEDDDAGEEVGDEEPDFGALELIDQNKGWALYGHEEWATDGGEPMLGWTEQEARWGRRYANTQCTEDTEQDDADLEDDDPGEESDPPELNGDEHDCSDNEDDPRSGSFGTVETLAQLQVKSLLCVSAIDALREVERRNGRPLTHRPRVLGGAIIK